MTTESWKHKNERKRSCWKCRKGRNATVEEQQYEKCKQEAEEWKHHMEDVKALMQEPKQLQEHILQSN